jgi:type VI secretion system protein ImpG
VREELLTYYERELTFLRQMGAEFAEKYPKIASRLQLESDRCEDPHVERILEGFAFLAARTHLKIDDEFPEITNALLSTLYPHYLNPVPSMTVVEFHPDPQQGKLTTGLSVPRGTMLYSKPVEGVPCKFTTSYDTTIWPISIAEAQWATPDRIRPALKAGDCAGVLQLVVQAAPDVKIKTLSLKNLQFYLSGESALTHTIYELLCNNCARIVVREPGSKAEPITLDARQLRPMGFAENEAMLPYTRRSFAGYRLLHEYFTFPEKFFFIELNGLEQIANFNGDKFEILFLISSFERPERRSQLETGISAKTFRLGCSPAINLYPQTAEPILVDQTKYEYPVIPDVRRRFASEIITIDRVVCTHPKTREVRDFEPFYSHRHALSGGDKGERFWHATRRSSGVRDEDRTDMYLTLVDLSGAPMRPEGDTVTVYCTCSNYTLPSRVNFGNESGDFELEGGSAIRRIVAIRKPSQTLRPPSERGAHWRLMSHLSLNYLSLVEDGKEALQSILELYNFSQSRDLQNQIAGINKVESTKRVAYVMSDHGLAATRGIRVDMTLDEDQFVGGGVYLFASVIEHFLGNYVSMNSFSQLNAGTLQRKEVLREWPPRAGRSILI